MATFDEKLEEVDLRMAKLLAVQANAQTQLDATFQRTEQWIPEVGKVVAKAMVGSAELAAQAHLKALSGVVQVVINDSRRAVADHTRAIQVLRDALELEVQRAQTVLRGLIADTNNATLAVRQVWEDGYAGDQYLVSLQARLDAMEGTIANHEVAMGRAIDVAQKNAIESLGQLNEAIEEMVPGNFLWFRGWFKLWTFLATIACAVACTYVWAMQSRG